ncbi:MAG TPA: response regulator transcription factor [Chloroflexia bacterium]|nr:response regulator transcription factor [Chloroflexia bacterium]
MRVLIVEDNHRLAQVLKTGLLTEGYAVDLSYNGVEGQQLAELTSYDAIILDIMLPDKDGLAICRALRQKRINSPILLLTAKDTVEDRVIGLDSGADDYLVKPFAMNELLARLRALLRRESSDKSGLLVVGDLIVDPSTHFVERDGQRIELTTKEYALVEYFARYPNQLISRERLENHVWNYDYEGVSNIIEVYMRRLRRKLDNPFKFKMFETIRGSGYRLRSPLDK